MVTMERTQNEAQSRQENPCPKRFAFTRAEIIERMRALGEVFDQVRLVDVQSCTQYQLSPQGRFEVMPDRCHMMWNRSERCTNCIGQRALKRHERISKVEFANSELFHMISRYVEVDGEPYVLELINSMAGDPILDGFGRQEIINSISAHNRRMYIDPLTGAYNRRYYEEQCRGLHKRIALAMLDLDDFKLINDTYGHEAGDKVLQRFAETVISCIRSTDSLIRYGGDEFLILLESIPEALLPRRLEQIRQKVECLRFDEYPELRLTVSIGAASAPLSVSRLISEADQRLYRAKAVKNCVCIDGGLIVSEKSVAQ